MRGVLTGSTAFIPCYTRTDVAASRVGSVSVHFPGGDRAFAVAAHPNHEMRIMRIQTAVAILGAVALAAGVSACGSSGSGDPATSSSAPPASASASAETSSPQASSAPAPAGLVIDLTIAGGKATPTNASFDAGLKEPITMRVSSDAEDELHVHSVPDHEFEVKAAPGQTFQFTVDVPGRVEVELHHLNVTVASINVR